MKLWTLNRVFRFCGFVLVVATGENEPTRLYFERKATFDARPKAARP